MKDTLAPWIEVQCPQWEGLDFKVVDTSQVKGDTVASCHYCREVCWAYPQLRFSDLLATLIPCKQGYTLKLSAITLNKSTSVI